MPGPAPELKTEIVRAGAGAGKTHQLTEKVLSVAKSYLATTGRLPKIVVCTFTRKATEELRERLVKKACEDKNPDLIHFVTSQSQLHISTIHGVLSLFLHRFGHWLDIDAGFSILEPSAADRMARKVLRDILVQNPNYEIFLEHFTIDEIVDMLHAYGEATVTVSQLQPANEEVLAQAVETKFKTQAVRTLESAESLLRQTSDAKWVEYLTHLRSCCQQLISAPVKSGYDWVERLTTISKPRYNAKAAGFDKTFSDDLSDEVDILKSYQDEVNSPEALKQYAELSGLFAKMATQFTVNYKKLKSSLGQIEMSDLELLSYEAVKAHPEIAQAFSADWDYWLIDEFQDTSPMQVQLLKKLTGHKPVYYVGDPQQSIYLFRGARSEVFAEKEKEIEKQKGELSQLKKNWRSQPNLLLFFNDFFKQFNQSFMEMQPLEGAIHNQEVVAQFKIVSKDDESPYAPLAQEIIHKLSQGAKLEDFCVLSRTNHELRELAQFFESLNIPTHVHASDGFYRRREILDILTLLKFLLNPLDNLNLIRLLRSPWLRISDQDLINSLDKETSFYWPHLQKKFAEHESIKKLTVLLADIHVRGIYQTLRQAVVDLGIVDISHYHDSTGRRESNIWKFLSLLREKEKTPGFSHLTFLRGVLQGEKSAEGDEESDAVAALEPNRVNLMTVHKAKGLQFKHVMIPNMGRAVRTSDRKSHKQRFIYDESTGQFTLALKMGEDYKTTHNAFGKVLFSRLSEFEKEESLRLLYVALTRAKSTVTMQWQEKATEGSWADLLTWDFSEGLHAQKNYSYLVERSFQLLPYENLFQRGASPRPVWKTLSSVIPESRRVSVSRLLETEATVTAPTATKKSPKDLKYQLELPVLGQRLHMLLEKIKYSKNIDLKAYSRKWFVERAEDFDRAIQFVLNSKTPPIKDLIEKGEVEWGFQLQTSRGVMEGQIDLWGTVDGVTWIIDYKSGSSHFKEKAFEQLNLYSLAIRESGTHHDIHLAVVYAIEGQIEIRQALSPAAIKARYNI